MPSAQNEWNEQVFFTTETKGGTNVLHIYRYTFLFHEFGLDRCTSFLSLLKNLFLVAGQCSSIIDDYDVINNVIATHYISFHRLITHLIYVNRENEVRQYKKRR